MPAKPRKPTYLAAEGAQLWRTITVAHPDLGPDQLRILSDAAREADLIQRLEEELRGQPLMVRGSQGQLVASPLVSEVRQHRAVLAGLLKGMRLPQTAAEAKRQEELQSEQARAAARARWDRPRLVADNTT